jgi:RND family efflux transporter MFP subunit
VAVAAGVTALLLSAPDEQTAPATEKKSAAERVAAVQVAPVRLATITERATYPGELMTEAVDVAPRVAGRLLAVEPRVGDRVEAGAVIARVDVAELEHQLAESRAQQRAAKAAGRRARTELAAAKRELGRTEGLVKDQLVSRQQVDTLEARVAGLATDADAADAQRDQAAARVATLQQRIEDATVTAPLTGVVSRRYLDAGAYAQVGSPIARIVAQRPLRVLFEVPERDMALVHGERTISVRTPGTGPLEVQANVRGVAGEVDRQRRTVLIEADVPEPPESWLPGMSAEVVSPTRTLTDALTLPAVAVVERVDAQGQPVEGVFVVDGEVARFVPVEVVGREGETAAVTGELTAGARVIVRGHGDLSDGARVRVPEPQG